MKRIPALVLSVFILWQITWFDAFPCTGVSAKTSKGILVGSNEDYNSTYRDIIARIRPARAGKYGYLATGFQRHDYFMMGLNDQGLFLDMFALPSVFPWVSDPNKLDYNGQLEGKILEECANVEQAIALLKKYNNPSMGTYPYQIFVVDSTGNSAVICWANGKIEVVRKQRDYQVVTNFYLLHPEKGWYPCWRYTTATERMENADEFSFRLFRDILDEVNLSSNYSQISNLSMGEMYIFNNHNFDEFVTLNIKREVEKGEHEILLPDYFSKIKLLSPADKEILPTSKQVTLKWQGDTSSNYQLYYSTDPDFANCKPIKVTTNPMRASFKTSVAILLLSLFFLSLSFKVFNRKIFYRFVIFFIVLCSMISCQQPDVNNIEIDYSNQTFSVTVKDLQPDFTYYWKIVATAKSTIKSESIVRTLRT
jgi:hypothetical protein